MKNKKLVYLGTKTELEVDVAVNEYIVSHFYEDATQVIVQLNPSSQLYNVWVLVEQEFKF